MCSPCSPSRGCGLLGRPRPRLEFVISDNSLKSGCGRRNSLRGNHGDLEAIRGRLFLLYFFFTFFFSAFMLSLFPFERTFLRWGSVSISPRRQEHPAPAGQDRTADGAALTWPRGQLCGGRYGRFILRPAKRRGGWEMSYEGTPVPALSHSVS